MAARNANPVCVFENSQNRLVVLAYCEKFREVGMVRFAVQVHVFFELLPVVLVLCGQNLHHDDGLQYSRYYVVCFCQHHFPKVSGA